MNTAEVTQVTGIFVPFVWLIAAFPLAAFFINGLFGKRWLGHARGRRPAQLFYAGNPRLLKLKGWDPDELEITARVV